MGRIARWIGVALAAIAVSGEAPVAAPGAAAPRADCAPEARYRMPPGVELDRAARDEAVVPKTRSPLVLGETLSFDLYADPFAGDAAPDPRLSESVLFLGTVETDRRTGDVTLDGKPLADPHGPDIGVPCTGRAAEPPR